MLRLDDALTALTAANRVSRSAPAAGWPAGAPAREFTRSPAAATVGRYGAAAGLFLFHYEHRVPLVTETEEWVDGVLPEPKYGAFRHDLPIGSFHPLHRGKWGAHELCHGLVGFGWRPDASPLFLATAARLAELAPVVLWYFLDEIGLARCERHDGPLFRVFCPACEAAAGGPAASIDEAKVARTLRAASDFLEDEFAAIRRTLRLGRPVSHVWGSIDLCSDGLAYAAGHRERLHSRWFGAFADRFLKQPDEVWHDSLASLEHRALAVISAMAHGDPLPVTGSRSRWVHWDLGQRLLEVWDECDGEAATELLGLADRLASSDQPSTVAEIYADYVALSEAYDLPEPSDVFAVGYPLDGVDVHPVLGQREVGASQVPSNVRGGALRPNHAVRRRLDDGLRSVVPMVLLAADDAEVDLVGPFAATDDGCARVPLGARFAAWLGRTHPGALAHLAAYEVALRTARADGVALALGQQGDGLTLAEGAVVLVAPFDVVAAAEQIDTGALCAVASDGIVRFEVLPSPTGLVIGRDAEGAIVLAEVPVEAAFALQAGHPEAIDPDVRAALASLGLLVPTHWAPGEGA